MMMPSHKKSLKSANSSDGNSVNEQVFDTFNNPN
jgi:hypothetical protein